MRATITTAAAFLASAFCIAAPALADPAPDWIAGNWLNCDNGMRVSETWSGAGTGLLVGHGLTHGPRGNSFEYFRIAPQGNGYAYFASPGGKPPVIFALVSSGPRSVVFENPSHDFPQRIAYDLEGDTLRARIELIDGSQSMSWSYQRAGLDSDCASTTP